jgi:hypothetical protein
MAVKVRPHDEIDVGQHPAQLHRILCDPAQRFLVRSNEVTKWCQQAQSLDDLRLGELRGACRKL